MKKVKKKEEIKICVVWCIPLISIEKSSSDGAEQMLIIPEYDDIYKTDRERVKTKSKWNVRVQVKLLTEEINKYL